MIAPTVRTTYFIAGLPRSGSTLLANILAQNPRVYVTPTSGIIDMLVRVRNNWDRNDAFRAHDRELSEVLKRNVLRSMLNGYFAHTDEPICIDKNRHWCEFLEMGRCAVGGEDRVRVLVTVRDLRDVVASFERLYRATSALGQIPQDAANELAFKTARGRFELFVDDAQPVGRAFNAIRDAVTRGWWSNMHFVEYDDLTRNPARVLASIYDFLDEPPYRHDFDHVEQVTFEDDTVYGFKNLHKIRHQVSPQEPHWPHVFDQSVQESPAWTNVERWATFWRDYQQESKERRVSTSC